eukprot:1155814-Pelagomonas_calceolata.AAC.4
MVIAVSTHAAVAGVQLPDCTQALGKGQPCIGARSACQTNLVVEKLDLPQTPKLMKTLQRTSTS